MMRSTWGVAAEEITQFLYLPGGLGFSFCQICLQVLHSTMWSWGYVSLTAVVSSIAFSSLPKGTATCVVFDPSDSWPAVVCDLPQFRSAGVSSLEHTNFSPPLCVAIMEAQRMCALIQFLFITMSVYSLPLGDILECGDLGCLSGSHSSSA